MAFLSTVANVLVSLRWYLVALVTGAYGWKLYRDYDRLKDFKGPWPTAWTNFWLVRAVGGLETHEELAKVCEKYGSVARIGPNILVTSSPELIYRMSAARSGYTKGTWYAGLRLPPGQDNLFSQMDEKMHTARKAQMAEGYSGKTNISLEHTVDSHVNALVNLIRSKYISTATCYKPMDLARKSAFFTMDVITDLAFAKPFGNLTNDEDMYRYIQSTEEMLPTMVMMSTIPALGAFFQIGWVGKMLFPSDQDTTGVGKLIGVAKKAVHERFVASKVDHQDMMSSFIAHGLNETDLVAESLLQILAGADTTATAIRATLLHVLTHPSVYRRLQNEIDDYNHYGRISSPVVQDAEAQKMKYLQAVIKEGLRIWPPVTGLLSKLSPEAGDEVEIDGKKIFIPGGTNIGYCAWGIHKSKEIFGADAEMFRPERWLIDDTERLARMHKTVDLVFGYGKYQCLGRPVALLELNKVFVQLLLYFDFELINPAKPWYSGNVGLWIQHDMWVRVTDRKAEGDLGNWP